MALHRFALALIVLALPALADDRAACQALGPDSLAACERLAAANDPVGLFGLGALHQQGAHGRPDPARAFRLFYESATRGHDAAQVAVALAYVNGNGVVRNYEEGYAWLLVARANGNPVAQRGLDMLDESALIPRQRMPEVERRAGMLMAPQDEPRPIEGTGDHCEIAVKRVDAIAAYRQGGRPKSEAYQLIVGMTDAEAIAREKQTIEWVWAHPGPAAALHDDFLEKCKARHPTVAFVY